MTIRYDISPSQPNMSASSLTTNKLTLW